ncbi:MAG: 30S ribosomal protein S17 [Micavibrio aeruginosavorus]|uniref:Small ribosomal subunit protein uS17 n=1 Tax=Micavibrio aeruginosavorus TaxID=349221 RepID=A0A2W5HFR4_9BACT|nr:MAG: 30S ribosomal protein S17 [Micavibrio aeruginosavorus]
MPRRVLQGRIVSDKMDKTVTVLVERRYMHPIYKKYVRRTDKYAAHDENNMFRAGDFVAIEECRPLSKRKSWTVITDPTTIKRSEIVEDTTKAAKPETKKKAAAKKKA